MTHPSHWSQVDPGPITLRTREQRIARLQRERDQEIEALERWRASVAAELSRTADFYDTAIAREKRRSLSTTTRKANP